MDTVEHFFSSRVWHRVVINVIPGFILVAGTAFVNPKAWFVLKGAWQQSVEHEATVWLLVVFVFFLVLTLGLVVEELGALAEHMIYDKLVQRSVDCERKSPDDVSYFYWVWDRYLFTEIPSKIPIETFYRNRLIRYKFLLSVQIVVAAITLELMINGITVASWSSLLAANIGIGSVAVIYFRLKSTAASLHQYRVLMITMLN